ncbi:endogenous retrovirus group 3 member 1 Env polyprotein-like [Narcine bancroftii]|uniref:endogenous retrovirus group 3 member 1 Env polyprotein-like n=1 Tax=Narcine bancroftii TaxID=1343680 RepID=UPI0038322A2B
MRNVYLLFCVIVTGCFLVNVTSPNLPHCIKKKGEKECKKSAIPPCSQFGCVKSYWKRGRTGKDKGEVWKVQYFEERSGTQARCLIQQETLNCLFPECSWCRNENKIYTVHLSTGEGSKRSRSPSCPPIGPICLAQLGKQGEPLVRSSWYLGRDLSKVECQNTTERPQDTPALPQGDPKDLYERARKQANKHRLGDNLWVDLHQLTVQELGVRNCWICSGPTRDGTWPWRGEPLDDRTLLASNISTIDRSREFWKLENYPQGFECLVKEHGRYPKGNLACRRWKNITSGNWVPAPPPGFLSLSNQSDVPCVPLVPINDTSDLANVGFWNCTGFNPHQAIPALTSFWENSSPSGYAPNGLYWICGNMAYTYLEPDWSGTCCIGMIPPHFHLLPPDSDEHISTRLHSPIQRRSAEIGKWGDDWPPEHIISYYGPATWAQDGSWGYQTPIYMINCLIRLQAVLEIITNQTATALDLLAEEQQQIWATVYQNRLALDYLLAAEGGVCGKLILSNCCLKIDNNGQAYLRHLFRYTETLSCTDADMAPRRWLMVA